MREIRLYGSEGGGALTGSPYPYPAEQEQNGQIQCGMAILVMRGRHGQDARATF